MLDGAKDWILHCDLGGASPTVPPCVAITSFRPDIFIYSPSLKHAISIENSSGCEENFSSMHDWKESKYAALNDSICENGWNHSLFCIEVGARGYCANNVSRCLKKLGFSNKKARDTAKSLGLTAMKASFALWLARSDKSKVFEEIKHPENIDKMRYLSPSFGSPPPPPSTPSRPSKTPPQSHVAQPNLARGVFLSEPVGLQNLGQTCYINSILQSLVCAHEIWRGIPQSELASSHFLKFLFTMLNLMKMKSNRVDPSNLISKLGPFISRAKGAPFHPNEPNDVPEVLGFILTEILACCPSSSSVFSLLYRIENFCDSCASSSRSEDMSSILCVPVRRSINLAIQSFFSSSSLSGVNQRFCGVCDSKQDGTSVIQLSRPPQILIVQLKRFFSEDGVLIKDSMRVSCDTQVFLSEEIEEPHTRHAYDLISVIDHSGSFSNGHYSCFVLDVPSGQWFLCNDSRVEKSSLSKCLNPYVLFYRRKQLIV